MLSDLVVAAEASAFSAFSSASAAFFSSAARLASYRTSRPACHFPFAQAAHFLREHMKWFSRQILEMHCAPVRSLRLALDRTCPAAA